MEILISLRYTLYALTCMFLVLAMLVITDKDPLLKKFIWVVTSAFIVLFMWFLVHQYFYALLV